MPLRPVLERGIAARRVAGIRWPGEWTDVGTPDRWAALQT
jgi:NDP-sugar pyrophosphorylase family protein